MSGRSHAGATIFLASLLLVSLSQGQDQANAVPGTNEAMTKHTGEKNQVVEELRADEAAASDAAAQQTTALAALAGPATGSADSAPAPAAPAPAPAPSDPP